VISLGTFTGKRVVLMATHPASTKEAAPAKKVVAKEPVPAASKPKAVAVPVVTLRAVFEQLRRGVGLADGRIYDHLQGDRAAGPFRQKIRRRCSRVYNRD